MKKITVLNIYFNETGNHPSGNLCYIVKYYKYVLNYSILLNMY